MTGAGEVAPDAGPSAGPRHVPLVGRACSVGRLGFGGTAIGNLFRAIDADTTDATIAAAWEDGLRFFDTAPLYGLGLSERRLGRALARHARDDYVLSTKVGRMLTPNPAPTRTARGARLFDVPDDVVPTYDFSAAGVLRSIEGSMRRLGVDRLDVALVHDPDEYLAQALTEALPTLMRLRDEGVVGAVGVGMNHWRPLREVVRRSDVDVVMIAGRWTLLDRSAGPLLDECLERHVSVLAAAPFNSGLLAQSVPADDATFDYLPADRETLSAARRWGRRARQHATTLPAAALQFPLRHPAVAAVVAGMASPTEVHAAVAHMNSPIAPAFWDGA